MAKRKQEDNVLQAPESRNGDSAGRKNQVSNIAIASESRGGDSAGRRENANFATLPEY
ncbi:hypothetical protein SAMN06298216_3164 [Spirosomataceae bacterium TFI 002]|nr:hypothetical protein SAMN06298216_3164 [Spirosomataceae bacterium TFI 002]